MATLPMKTVRVDGTNDVAERTTALVGVVDGGIYSLSGWYKRDADSLGNQVSLHRNRIGNQDRIGCGFTNGNNTFGRLLNDVGGNLGWWTSTAPISTAILTEWFHFLFAMDVTVATGLRVSCYINGVAVPMTLTQGSGGGNAHLSGVPQGLLAKPAGNGAYLKGEAGATAVSFDTYWDDPTVFRLADGCPNPAVASDGSNLPGGQPAIYCDGRATSAPFWWTNLGPGGPFNEVGDWLDGTTSPSDGCGPPPSGRVMSSLVGAGGLVASGGIAGYGGGLAA